MKKYVLLFFLSQSLVLSGQALFDSTVVGLIAGGENNFFDTTLSISSYHLFTDYGIDDFGFISLGNQGDVRRSLTFITQSQLRPHLGIDGYFKNFSCRNCLPFYNVKVPYGGIRLLTGYNKGQLFGLNFTINPISRLNIYVDFQRINSRGFYFNQENRSDQLLLSSSYYSKNQSYKIKGGLQWNKSSNLEWGGIIDTLDFQLNTLTNRELIPVRLMGSSSIARQLRISIDQQLRLLQLGKKDLVLFMDAEINNQSFMFLSSDSAFVANSVFQDSPIRDSIRLGMVSSFTGISWLSKQLTESNEENISLGITHFSHIYGNAIACQQAHNFGLKAFYSGRRSRLFWEAKGELLLTNSFAGTYDVEIITGVSLIDKSLFKVSLFNQSNNPGLFYQRYFNNAFAWNNAFAPIGKTGIHTTYKRKKFNVNAGLERLSNIVYLDQLAMPKQHADAINYAFIEGSGNLSLGANFYLDSRLRYQYVSNERIIRTPSWILREILYFERDLFNHATRLQAGVELEYFSSFESEAYMPATSMMYLQDGIRIGNFPYFNFLLNFKIQEFTCFLRLENISQGLFKYNYYAAPYYPLPDFTLRIGATWRFFN